ncbi:hypothetical protein HYU93_01315 [Candidatus Daviesbacteria bacterium]|nr:hypothetical protein [Candidatus Daviesbacteria bacterium]
MFTKFVCLFATSFLLLFVLVTPSFAASPVATPSAATTLPSTTYNLPAYVSPTSPIYTDLLVNNLFHSFSCLAIGQSVIGQPCLSYKLTKDAQGVLQGVPVLSQTNFSGGTLGAVTGLVVALYQNPPVRTADYVASISGNFGIVREAQAQVAGSGSQVLNPILSLWQVSRNISYVLMIIIFLIIGFMVLFRNKLNPQTVITAQAALPGLVIGLIMITLSYFFASLLTDTAFLGVNVVGYYFSAAQPGASPKLVQDISNESVVSIFSRFVGQISHGDIGNAMGAIMNHFNTTVTFYTRLFAAILGFSAGNSLGSPIGSLAGLAGCIGFPTLVLPGVGAALGAIGAPVCSLVGGIAGGLLTGIGLGAVAYLDPAFTFGLVLFFIAIAVLIYTMFKLLLKLITNYLNIIFLTISAPFQFLFASLPGRQNIITGWILSMLCNVLAFPAVYAVFYFAAYLFGPTSDGGGFFGITSVLNPTDNHTIPLFGGLNLSFIRMLLAFGALLATPAIPDIICRAVGRASQAGQMIGQEIGAETRSGQGYYGQFTGGVGRGAGAIGQATDTWYGRPPGESVSGLLAKRPGVNLPGILKKRIW